MEYFEGRHVHPLCPLWQVLRCRGLQDSLHRHSWTLPHSHQVDLFSTPTYVCTTQPEICNHPSDRNSMLGVCSTIARVGGIAAPWVAVYLPDQVLNLTLDLVDPQPSFRGRDLWAIQCRSTSSEPPPPWPVSLLPSASQSHLDRPSQALSRFLLWEDIPKPSMKLFRDVFLHFITWVSLLWQIKIALQDLEKMKANAKPAWKCVCPSREEEEDG